MIPSCCCYSRTIVLAALVSTGVAVMMVGAYAQQQAGRGQAPAGGQQPPAGGTANLTGKGGFVDSSDMRSSRLRFEAGARTYWHIHSAGQLLLIEDGKGRLQEQGSAIRDLLVNQPVMTKPNVLHWHGAAPDQGATQFTVYSGTLEWKEAVTDDEYLGKKIR
jgi:quercetin dioxygenase-like cupin family protein